MITWVNRQESNSQPSDWERCLPRSASDLQHIKIFSQTAVFNDSVENIRRIRGPYILIVLCDLIKLQSIGCICVAFHEPIHLPNKELVVGASTSRCPVAGISFACIGGR